jgi:protein ImuB
MSGGLEDRTERCAALIDKLQQRLGPSSVRRFEAVASHIPERAEVLAAVNGAALQCPPPEAASDPQADSPARPLLLLPHAEPAEDVMALVPEGPPRRFRWRGVTYEIEHAEGPERIAAAWWRVPSVSAHSRASGNPEREDERQPALTRDYYLVEDLNGHRFWLFRQGLFGRETAAAQWFVHGLFA